KGEIGGDRKETVLITTQTVTGHDNTRKTLTHEHSLNHGQPLLSEDDNGVQIRYEYDALQRVTKEIVAPNLEAFRAEREYSYALCATDQDQAGQTRIDVQGVETYTSFDGLNRVVDEKRQDKDFSAGTVRQLYTALYDVLGQLQEQVQTDWCSAKTAEDLTMTTKYEYDDWGSQRVTVSPDGVRMVSETDPIGTARHRGVIVTQWSEPRTGSLKTGRTIVDQDLFGNPVQIERKRSDNTTRESVQVNMHDGLGRLVKKTLGSGSQQARISEYEYDAFGRVVKEVLPDKSEVMREYAAHSREDLPTSIKVKDVRTGSTFELGTQTFDGLGRMSESVTGGRNQVFSYQPGMRKPQTVTVNSGEVINYEYEPRHTDQPVSRSLGGDGKRQAQSASYQYHGQTARLSSCKVGDQELLKREYYTNGKIKSEARPQSGLPAAAYGYSHLGLLTSFTTVLGQVQTYEYDLTSGQLKKTTIGSLATTFLYDLLGRLLSFTTVEGGQSLRTALTYDDFGRELTRTFTYEGGTQVLTQAYNDDDALSSRELKQGTTSLRRETFVYDRRQRLIDYTCIGSERPQDQYGNPMKSQKFEFDGLDNVRKVTTVHDTGTNVADYAFAADDGKQGDPVQLVNITNSTYPDASISLEYDANGNLIRDEQGRVLEYDGLNRLLSVSDPSAKQLLARYRYDPLDILSATEHEAGTEQRFYQGNELINMVEGASKRTFFKAGGQVLGEQEDQ
ncbi:sugar-binding protein, partial [Pseudomonas sp. xss_2]